MLYELDCQYDTRNSFYGKAKVLETNNKIMDCALGSANDAFKRFFNKQCNYPKYKSKHNFKQSFASCRCIIYSKGVGIMAQNIYGGISYPNTSFVFDKIYNSYADAVAGCKAGDSVLVSRYVLIQYHPTIAYTFDD